VIRLLLIGLLLFTTIGANIFTDESITEVEEQNLQKVLYLNYETTPTRVLKGEIFKVTIKSLSTTKDFTDIVYELSESYGLKLLNELPSREIISRYYYETFYFLVTSTDARLPDFTATLLTQDEIQHKSTTIKGHKLNVINLNPKKDFSNILANSFQLNEYKTTSYDNRYNIVIFSATAKNCDITAFSLNNLYKQGVESLIESHLESKITYYAVIDKKMKKLSFSYFNLLRNKFLYVNIPIILDDDSVSTQSDLKPKNISHEKLKMSIAATVALILFFAILWRKKYIYLIFILFPIAYIIYIGSPSEDICIKESSDIYLLPVSNGTIFDTTSISYTLKKEGKTKGWTKIQLENKKIGWIKDEDICSY
jgi:hypothetical protein